MKYVGIFLERKKCGSSRSIPERSGVGMLVMSEVEGPPLDWAWEPDHLGGWVCLELVRVLQPITLGFRSIREITNTHNVRGRPFRNKRLASDGGLR